MDPVTAKRSSRFFWFGCGSGILIVILVLVVILSYFWNSKTYVVISGSMAGGLCGPHSLTECRECGFSYRCGLIDGQALQDTICPNCGSIRIGVEQVIQRSGDTLIVKKSEELPQRWQTVVLQSATPGFPPKVKRVVGLPGERIGIRNGNVYVNDEIPPRSLSQFRTMAVLVHDDDYLPHVAKMADRWLPIRDEHHWQFEDRVKKRAAHADSGNLEPTITQLLQLTSSLDWLVYRHYDCSPTARHERHGSTITDYLAYNQGLPMRQHRVSDVMLSCHATILGDGLFVVRIATGFVPCVIMWDVGRGRLTMISMAGGEVSVDLDLPRHHRAKDIFLEIAVFDKRIIVGINHQSILNEPLSLLEASQPSTRPFALLSHGVSVNLWRLKVFRDIYYLDPSGANRDWMLATALGSNEYFVLGDNPVVSTDSRHWRKTYPLLRKFILGKVLKPGCRSDE